MKKKFVSLLSLILAVVMVFPVSVFAGSEGEETPAPTTPVIAVTETPAYKVIGNKKTFYFDSVYKTLTLTVTGGDGENYDWSSNDPAVATVDGGIVTPKKAGTASISVTSAKKTASISLTFTPRTCDDIEVTTPPTKLNYIEGDAFDPAGMVVTASYNSGESLAITDYTIEISEQTTNGGLSQDSVVKVKYANHDDTVDGIEVSRKYVVSVSFTPEGKYNVGDAIPEYRVKVTFNNGDTKDYISGYDVYINGEKVDIATRKFKADDTKIKVAVEGVFSSEYNISVEPEETEPTPPAQNPTTYTYSLKVKDGPTKKSYKVGETFDDSGMSLYLVSTSSTGNSSQVLFSGTFTYNEYVFKSSDAGKNYIDLVGFFIYNNVTYSTIVRVEGLTITEAVNEDKIKEVTSVTLNEDAYPEEYEFTLADINKIKVKFVGDSSATTIEFEEFEGYSFTSGLSLEVYTADGNRKTSTAYRDTIRSEDIYTEDGDKLVNMALVYKYYTSSSSSVKTGEYKFTIELGEADVAYYHKTKYITEYEELEDALKYCNEQDDDIEDIFDFSKVDEDDYLMLKLGKSYSLSSNYEFTPENNIVIDLNGHELSMYTDTFDIDDDEDFTITVKNNAEADAVLKYRDKDVNVVLEKGASIVFKGEDTIPGIYTVTVTFDSDMGTVTADPKISSGKIEIGRGGEIEFTITPKTGYEINTVKAASKSVLTDKDNYSVDKNGVATYKLTKITKDTAFEVTFKATKSEWKNPFNDVKSTAEYYSAVEFVYEHELFKGTSDTTFSPNSTMTRAMFVTVLGRLSGMDDTEAVRKYGYDSDFTDVSSSNSRIKYAVPYIKWAVENGIVEGYGDGTFGPENEITHQQMYVMMYRYARFVENKSDSAANVSLSMSDRSSVADWAADAVKYAQYNNYLVYTNTTKTRIDPTGDALRSELAMLLESFCQTVMGWAE